VLIYGQSPYREDGTRNTHSKDLTNAIRMEDALPAIIDRDLFETVQKRMAQNKRQQGGRPATKREYPLRGRVFCADCKSAMTISTSHQKYNYYRCTGKKRLHNCDMQPIGAEYLEQRVAEAVRSVLGSPSEANGLIQILRDQAEKLQDGAMVRLHALLQREREVARKLDNAVEAVLNGLSSQAIQAKISELEQEKAVIQRDLKQLKQAVDASTIPEQRLREILATIISSADNDAALLESLVYRVEVGAEDITIWTILEADPNGDIDHTTTQGVTITNGVPSGVPTVIVTAEFVKITIKR
jgi:site-specific DNA recombinase